ncbi:hypothetical protein [Pseudomonas carassii]|uniref:Uncharacterized protein n=1 Tax=Pseudomonas carassii TaxID=3115855 RepID=A0ABU7H9L9_9PSED|nr:hypothetical protein [Pseudomonas sp. 137P]MEE1888042.1 hypothetical protein [Pseudomonas sp. 137P]
MDSEKNEGIDLQKYLEEKGFKFESKLGFPGSSVSSGEFEPAIMGRSEYQANEFAFWRNGSSLFVMAREQIQEGSGYKWSLGTAFYINAIDSASPNVVNAFIVKNSGLHIGTDITGTPTLEGGVLYLSNYNFTARVGHDHKAKNVKLQATLPSS